MIYEKLYEIQKKIQNLSKNAENSHFRHTYADLNQTLDELKPLYHEHGVLILQYYETTVHKGQITQITELVDIDDPTGPTVKSSLTLSADENDPQKQAAASTYARRYNLQTIAVVGADDDDGNQASGISGSRPGSHPSKSKARKVQAPKEARPISQPQPKKETRVSKEEAEEIIKKAQPLIENMTEKSRLMYGDQLQKQFDVGAYEMVMFTFKSIEKTSKGK